MRPTNRTTVAQLGRGGKAPVFTGSIMSYDPGLATGALAVVRFDRTRAWFVATATWEPLPAWNVPTRLSRLREWLDWFRDSDSSFATDISVFAYEDQTFSGMPRSGVAGRTNANARQPMMAQSVALGWAATWAPTIVTVQPLAVRKAALGTAARFRAPSGLGEREVARARREHDKRVNAAAERALGRLVGGLPEGLSVHELDAVAICLAARAKMGREGASFANPGRRP